MQDLLNRVNKRDVNRLDRDSLNEVLRYYMKLNVVFINPDDQLIFL